jgi:hypothetical protein
MKKFALAIFLLAAVPGGIPANASEVATLPPSTSTLTRQQVILDLTYFRDTWAKMDRSYTTDTRRQMVTFIDQQIATAHPMDKAGLALILSEAAALTDNDHTLIGIYNTPDVFHTLPISFWWFPEGAIITRAHPGYRQLLGAKIISIDDIPIEQVASRVERFIPGIPTHKQYMSTILLTRIEVLREVGVTTNGVATFELMLPSGKRIREQLGIAPTPDPAAVSPAWQASLVPGKGPQPWPHVLDGSTNLPPYLQPRDEMSWRLLHDNALLYIRSTSLSPYTDDPYAVVEKGYTMIDTIVKSGHIPGTVVVDLRFNEGGNFFNVLALATELVKMTEPSGRIYVITGNATNSAAIAFTALLKSGAPSRTKIIGEPISDHEWFWSEGGTLKAPASGLPLRYTDGYHDWKNGCSDLKECYWPVVFHGTKAGSLQPDITVPLTYASYVRGDDPVMDAIYADMDK